MPRNRQQRGRLHSAVNDGSKKPTVERPQLGRSLETADYLAWNWKFESRAARADELFAEQDHDGAAVWRRIIDAIGQLANTKPSGRPH
jgi:hypothetical protein